ncbi:MAG: glucuronate isomerase [Planctomycetota bacterium]
MPLMHDDFMLANKHARILYHEYAKDQPIIDYHCHLPPQQVAENHRFDNIAQIWLGGDHYKWRQMRTNGISEHYCTGDASDREKFGKWAETVPKCLRNPLYHWTHLEMKRPFGIDDLLLGPDTADAVWDRCNAYLATDAGRPWALMEYFKVETICTTDDPCDSLEHHDACKRSACATRVLPTWRPDKAFKTAAPAFWNGWMDQLGAAADVNVRDWESFLQALQVRHDAFHAAGCRLSDYGLERCFRSDATPEQAAGLFRTLRGGTALGADDAEKLAGAIHIACARMDAASGWVMQLHVGAMRNNNTRLFERLGPDTGFDSIGDYPQAETMSRFLDSLDRSDELPRTILYNLNPRDNEVMATMIGNFQDGSCPGKMQYGAGWWFLDQWDGMTRQIEALSQLGLLSRFVGMLTDSRSFLSYTRHEYFRRLLCSVLGQDIKRGAIPKDYDLVGNMVADISYRNARDYFNFAAV